MTENLNDRLLWDADDGVVRITLARPDRGNALDLAMARAFREATERVRVGAARGELRVVVLDAQGKLFCVGGDLEEFVDADDRSANIVETADELHAGIEILHTVPVPVVSVIQGSAAGGGLGIALTGDIVLASAEAKLRVAYSAAGLSPDCGTTWVLARRLGTARALDLALTNRFLTADEAQAWGLISRSVPADALAATAAEVIDTLRTGSTPAQAAIKNLMTSADETSLRIQLQREAATIGRIVDGDDAVEGMTAFLEKRVPRFA
ncbi:enoyl-CoA hydratase/isomerase family protein [Gordonia hydrophobica]|nr:enoyl-CoA hydratase-related protein [Gordonia hydrophobica]MBM7365658.1 2-(1,2-epoxy-1,2-dihydrophenyl)acetyl-CoA isomerase [Gordonia hydrophobica]